MWLAVGSLRKTDTSFNEERLRCGGSIKLIRSLWVKVDHDEDQPGISESVVDSQWGANGRI